MDDDVKQAHEVVLERARRIGAALELAGLAHDYESVAALCFLAAVGARRLEIPQREFINCAEISFREAEDSTWDVTP
jgi:hypothetical protein